MTENEMQLDGNAAAGLLGEIFVVEMTTAIATCASCGESYAIGAEPMYATAMGTVIRCAACDDALIRIARGRTGYWLDMRGIGTLRIAV